MAHGSQKLFGAFGGHGIEGFSASLSSLGVPYPVFQAYLASGAEFFGGFLLVVGLCVRLASVPLIVTMLVAILKVHWAKGFFAQNGGFEYPFILLMTLLVFVGLGSGACSVDLKLAKPAERTPLKLARNS